MRYNNLSGYFREKYGKRVKKYASTAVFPAQIGTEPAESAAAFTVASAAQESI